MKKIIALMLVLSILLSSVTVFAEDDDFSLFDWTGAIMEKIIEEVAAKFKDFKKGQWYSEVMARLTILGGFTGFPDGTIRPNATISKGEFTKILVASLDNNVSPRKGVHWARPWVDKAVELRIIPGYIAGGYFNDSQLNEPITRELMAVLIANSTEEYVSKEDAKKFEKNVSDLWEVTYKDEVLKTYALGLINGYTNGTFRPKNNLTRAEASATIIRVIDTGERVPNEPLGEELYSKNPETQYINELGKRYPDNSAIYSSYNFRYNALKIPESKSDIVLLVTKIPAITTNERDYSIVLFDNHTEKEKEVLKDVLKDLYPTSYEKVYNQAIARFKDHQDAEDITDKLDNRTIRYIRDDGSIHLIVGIKGK